MELSGHSPQNYSLKKFLILFPKKIYSQKSSYISGNRTFWPQD